MVERDQGIKHLLGPTNTVDDYDEFISKGDDTRIYGRYSDIENLGADILIDET